MQSVSQTVLPRSAVFAFTHLCPRMIAHVGKPRVPNVHEIFARNVPLYKISGTDRETATHRTKPRPEQRGESFRRKQHSVCHNSPREASRGNFFADRFKIIAKEWLSTRNANHHRVRINLLFYFIKRF